MTRIIIVASVLSAILCTFSAPAGATTNNTGLRWLQGCADATIAATNYLAPDHIPDVEFCMGAVDGARDIMASSGSICPPPEITLGQDIRIVSKYLNDHPAELHERISLLIERALGEAWPCPQR